MPAYKELGESLGSAIGTGYEAQSKFYERRSAQDLYRHREFQRQNLFDVLYGAIGLGSNLYDIYSENQQIMDWATSEKQGYKVTSNWLENLFGSVEFEKGGEAFTAAELSAKKLLGIETLSSREKMVKDLGVL